MEWDQANWKIANSPQAAVHISGASGDLFKLKDSTAVKNIFDEDDMASNSNTALATQQSIRSYVDTVAPNVQVGTKWKVAHYQAADNSIYGDQDIYAVPTTISGEDTMTLAASSSALHLESKAGVLIKLSGTSAAYRRVQIYDRLGIGGDPASPNILYTKSSVTSHNSFALGSTRFYDYGENRALTISGTNTTTGIDYPFWIDVPYKLTTHCNTSGTYIPKQVMVGDDNNFYFLYRFIYKWNKINASSRFRCRFWKQCGYSGPYSRGKRELHTFLVRLLLIH